MDIVYSQFHLFAAGRNVGLHSYHLKNTTTPVLDRTYVKPTSAGCVAISGSLLVVGDRSSEVHVFDISDPTRAVFKGSFHDVYGVIRAMDVSGSQVLIADSSNQLLLLDVSNPIAPSLLSRYQAAGLIFDVALSGSKAFIAVDYVGVQVIDFSTPEMPVLVTSYDTPGKAHGVEVSGQSIFVADVDGGLLVLHFEEDGSP